MRPPKARSQYHGCLFLTLGDLSRPHDVQTTCSLPEHLGHGCRMEPAILIKYLPKSQTKIPDPIWWLQRRRRSCLHGASSWTKALVVEGRYHEMANLTTLDRSSVLLSGVRICLCKYHAIWIRLPSRTVSGVEFRSPGETWIRRNPWAQIL